MSSYEPGDVELILADPDFAESLGIELPRCCRCGGKIKRPHPSWDGTGELVHLLKVACEWVLDGTLSPDVIG